MYGAKGRCHVQTTWRADKEVFIYKPIPLLKDKKRIIVSPATEENACLPQLTLYPCKMPISRCTKLGRGVRQLQVEPGDMAGGAWTLKAPM